MNVLYITYTRIGDAVLSTGVLDTLRAREPGARFTVACGPAAAELFVNLPGLDRIVPLRKRPASGHWFGLWRACAGRRWDLVVDLRNSVVPYLLRAERRRVLGRAPRDRHRVEHIASVLDLDPPPAPRLWIDPGRHARAGDLVPGGGPALALGPTANWPGKIWPGPRFGALAERLTGPAGILAGAPVVVLGAAAERQAAAPVLESIPAGRRIDLVGRVDLLTAAAVLARCSLFIGNDSGLMHVAAASGVPTLGLFGPSREQHYAPWGPHAAAVRTRRDYDQLVGTPGFDHRKTGSLMESLPVAAVEEAATRLWHRWREHAA